MANETRKMTVQIDFRANTETALKNVQSLNSLLTQITQTKSIGLDSSALNQAKASAQELQLHLEKAMNVETGRLDLGKFNASLKSAGTDLAVLSQNLRNMGPVGQQAFTKLAKSIAAAETPMLNFSTHFANFGKTMMNTIKWTLASSMIQGVTGSLQGAVTYAQQLNNALNDIRIVTGYSVDKMAEFAVEARAAARELNTTTTEYAKASLIFFQQGLTGDAVKERADATVKLAQVTHESAETVSSQLTAIWNNFDDGVHTLEWYADAITALGAATASSSKEIATGIEKFAAIADTVGLSYEYATAALATVVAETRQSADIVGTSFKTIFARMEGLKLGETLDDGTDLNKYSEALLTVGVNIKKANGDLKDMDQILDEVGERWEILGRDQQIALAQVLGGMRQYQQFIALADNWSKVQKNIELARNSEGTLSKQQQIWSESFAAAAKRVEEAKKRLYDDMLNDEALIKLNDIFANMVSGLGNVIKTAGGIVPMIMMIVGALSNQLYPLIRNGMARLKENIDVISGRAQQRVVETQNLMRQQLTDALNESGYSEAQKQQIVLTRDLVEAKQQLDLVTKNMTAAQKAEAEMQYAIYEIRNNELQAQLTAIDQTQQEVDVLERLNKVRREAANEAEYAQRVTAFANKGRDEKDQFSKAQVAAILRRNDKETLKIRWENELKRKSEAVDKAAEKVESAEKKYANIYTRPLLEHRKAAIDDSANPPEDHDPKRKIITANSSDTDVQEDLKYLQEKRLHELQGSKSNLSRLQAEREELQKKLDLLNKINEAEMKKGMHPYPTGKVEVYGLEGNADFGLSQRTVDFTKAATKRVLGDTKLLSEPKEGEENPSPPMIEATEEALTKFAGASAQYKAIVEEVEAIQQDLNKSFTSTPKPVRDAAKALTEAQKKLEGLETTDKNYAKALRGVEVAQKAYDAAVKQSSNTTQQFIQSKQQAQNILRKLGQQAGLSEKEIDELVNSLNNIEGEDDLERVNSQLEDLANNARNASQTFKDTADDIEGKLAERLDPKQLGDLDAQREKAEKAGAAMAHLAAEQAKVMKPPVPELGKFDLIAQKVTGIASGLSRVAMAYNGLKSIVNIWTQEDVSIMEKIMTSAMSFSMVLPVLIGGIKALNTARVASKILRTFEKADLPILTKEKIVEAGATTSQTVATNALNVAKTFQLSLMGPLGWAILAGAVAIGVATVAIIANTKKTKENTQALKENQKALNEAKDATSAIQAWTEQASVMEGLISKYKNLTTASKEYQNSVDEIIEQVPELIKHYEELSKSLKLSTEDMAQYVALRTQLKNAQAAQDVERIAEITQQIDELLGGRSQEKIERGKTAASKSIGNLINSKDIAGGENYSALAGDRLYFQIGGFGKDEDEVIKALQQSDLAPYIRDSRYGNGWSQFAEFKAIDLTNPEETKRFFQTFIDVFNSLTEGENSISASSQQSASYQAMKEIVERITSNNEEGFNQLLQLFEANTEVNLRNAITELKAAGEDISDIASYSDYQTYFKQLMNQTGNQYEESVVEDFLESNDVTRGFVELNRRFKAVADLFGDEIRQEFLDYYNELSEEDKDIMLKVRFQETPDVEALKKQMEIVRKEVEEESLTAELTIVTTGLEVLKKKDGSLTADNLIDLRDGVNWEQLGISYENFLKLSSNAQAAWLENYKTILVQTRQSATDSIANLYELSIEDLERYQQLYSDTLEYLSDADSFYINQLARDNKITWDQSEELRAQEIAHYTQLLKTTKITLTNQEAISKQKQLQIDLDEQLLKQEISIAITSAETLESLQQALAEARGKGVSGRQEEIAALIGLGGKYTNASQETSAFQNLSNALGEIQKARSELQKQLDDAIVITPPELSVDKGGSSGKGLLSNYGQLGATVDFSSILDSDEAISDKTYNKLSSELNELTQKEAELNAQLLKQEDILRASILVGEAGEKYGLDTKEVEAQIQVIREFNDTLELSEEQIARMAIANQRMNKGVSALSDGLKDWKEALKTAVKGDADWAKVLNEVEDAVRDLIGATDDFELPADFLDAPEHMKLLEKAANGDIHAINQLGVELAETAIKAMDFNVAMANAFEQVYKKELNSSVFEEIKNSVLDGIDTIQSRLQDLENGVSLNEVMAGQLDNWILALNEMAMATGMSVEQMNATLNQLGVQAHIETIPVKQPMWIPTYTEYSNYKEYDPGDKDEDTGMWIRPPGYAREHYTVPGEPMYVEGWATVAQISTEDNKLTPNIKENKVSFTGVGGGKTSGGISKGNTTSGKKAKSKSGKSSRDTKDKKSAEQETERYHEILKLLENYNRELDKSSKAKDRAFGPAKLKAMQAEMQAQAQINAGVEEYIREIQEWLVIDKQRIAAQGAVFDEYGNIANYTALMAQHVATYNAAVAAYNSGAQDDAAKERFKQAEEAYKNFTSQLKQYEETNKLLQEQQDALLEGLQKIYDLTTERNKYIIEFKLMADDDVIAFLDYLKNKLDNFTDGVNDAIERLAHLNDEVGRLMSKNSTYNDGINRTLQHYLGDQKGMNQSAIDAFIARFKSGSWTDADVSLLEDMSEDEFNYLREMRDGLIEVNNAFIEAINEVVETVKNQFMQSAEELEKAARPIERAASALENYAAIIDIVGKDALGITEDIAAHLDQTTIDVAHSATVAAKATMDSLIAQRAEAQRLYDEAIEQGNMEMAYKWQQVFEEMDESIAQAADTFQSTWQDELTKARTAFENTIDRLKKKLLDAFAGSSGSWYALRDSLEYAQTAADRFVPQYQEIYELSKLNRDINKSIDNTSNIKSKQILRDLQREINELEAKSGEISQYDLDNARRRYELELARLQLEEARDAKSTVRLSKDSEGNWSYIYTANQDDVAAAEQNYEDKLYAMQQANNEYINTLSNQILELEEQYAEKLAEIRLDNTLSEEERNAAIERLNAFFAEQMAYLTGEGQKAVDNNARLFEEEWTVYHNWTDAFGRDTQARIDSQEDFLTRFEDTIIGAYVGGMNFDDLNRLMVEIAQNASAQMQEANNEWLDNLARAMDGAGVKIDEFAQHMENNMYNRIIPSAQQAEQAVVRMSQNAVTEMQKLVDKTSTWQEKYVGAMEAIMAQNELLTTSLNTLIDKYAELIAAMGAVANVEPPKVPQFNHSDTDAYSPNPGGNGGGGNGDSNSGPGDPNIGSSDSNDGYYYYKQTTTKHQKCWYSRANGKSIPVEEPQPHKWAQDTTGQRICAICGYRPGIDGNTPTPKPTTFASGGYTGDWNGSYGKLAILHEKELILNQEDTANILGTVEMVRKLSQSINLKANASRFAFDLSSGQLQVVSNNQITPIEQTVTISAEFPNVQNRTEIEEAFTTLINRASQFANQKI